MEDIVEIALEMRKLAESLFGAARDDWALGTVYFADGKPCIVYLPAERVIEIQLSRRAEDDHLQMMYQLAHEVCHTLHPSMDGESLTSAPTIVLNEGVSTWFSCFVCGRFGWGEAVRDSTLTTAYAEPMLLVERLLEIDPQAVAKLRAFRPWLDRVVPSDFAEAKVDVPADLAVALCQPF